MSTINVTNLSGRGGATPNLPDGANITGVATATSFDGNLKSTGTPTLGLGVTINSSGLHVTGVTTVGVVTGGTFYGDGSNLTGVGESIAPWHYNPDVNDVVVTPQTGIGITFNKKILSGSGTATIKIVNAGVAGTTIQSWGVSSATYSTTQFSLGALVSDLLINQTYQVDIPEGFLVSSTGTNYAGTAYTFTVQDAVDKLWAIGDNTLGELGQNSRQNFSSPVQIPGTTWNGASWSSSGNGFGIKSNTHQVIVKSDGTLWTWGHGNNGKLGQNDVASLSSPTQVGTDTTWSTVSRGYFNCFAKKTDGTLWAWGFNDYGQLGQNNKTEYSSPVQIPGTTWTEVTGGYYHTLGVKTDGTLWSWGDGHIGVLGKNSTTDYSSPIQIGSATNWKQAQGGWYTSAAVKTNGELFVWGNANHGKMGENQPSNLDRSSPIQIPGTTWSIIEAQNEGMSAIKTDGTLWTWGRNEYGQLAINDVVSRSSPVQIPGTTWSVISSGTGPNTALKTDGTAWAWGRGAEGPLGQNSTAHFSSPVQIGSETDFTAISNCSFTTYLVQRDTTP